MRSPYCLCVCVSHPIVARQQLGKHVPSATNTRAKAEPLDAVFSMRFVVSNTQHAVQVMQAISSSQNFFFHLSQSFITLLLDQLSNYHKKSLLRFAFYVIDGI
jgi:hypothetical protein